MAVVCLLLGAIIGFAAALVAYGLLGISLLTALGIWSLIGAGVTVVLISFALTAWPDHGASLVAENA